MRRLKGSDILLALLVIVTLPFGWIVLREVAASLGLVSTASKPSPTASKPSPNLEAARNADLIYFYSPTCPHCRRTTPVVERVVRENPDLRAVFLNVDAENVYELRDWCNRRANLPLERWGLIPALFTRQRGFVGDEPILANLKRAVREAPALRAAVPATPAPQAAADVRERAKALLSPLPVAGAALADSVNPCAISTALFLISYLAWAGRSRRHVAVTGALYCLGVFLCYGLIGMGLLRGFHALKGIRYASLGLYVVFGAVTLLMGTINIRQYVLLRRKAIRITEVGLPQAARLATHSAIRNLVTRPALFGLATFATGAVIAALELPCTGQMYLPTIAYLATRGEAVGQGYLVLYNLIFITPLVAIFALAAAAKPTRTIQDLVRRHLPATRLANAVCFFAMAAYFLGSVIWWSPPAGV
ncbi:MAG: hypothetical protein HY320_10585 [Armatimonadetes bacterium]|nr:hypothetical protein [Armatimonadota bacterium]